MQQPDRLPPDDFGMGQMRQILEGIDLQYPFRPYGTVHTEIGMVSIILKDCSYHQENVHPWLWMATILRDNYSNKIVGIDFLPPRRFLSFFTKLFGLFWKN